MRYQIGLLYAERHIITSVGEYVEKLELSHTDGRNVKWQDHLGQQSCSSPNDPVLRFISNGNKCTSMNTHSNITHNSQKRWK